MDKQEFINKLFYYKEAPRDLAEYFISNFELTGDTPKPPEPVENEAIIKVMAEKNATVTCKKGDIILTSLSENSKYVYFTVDSLGEYTIQGSIDGVLSAPVTVNVTEFNKEYSAELVYPRYGIRVTTNPGNSVYLSYPSQPNSETIVAGNDGIVTIYRDWAGIYTVHVSSADGSRTATGTVEATTRGEIVDVEVKLFVAYINVHTEPNAIVIATYNTIRIEETADSNGDATLEVYESHTYNVISQEKTYNNYFSNTTPVAVTETNETYEVTVQFTKIIVYIEDGSEVTLKLNMLTMIETSANGKATFIVNGAANTYNITCTKGDNTVTGTVTAVPDETVELTLSYPSPYKVYGVRIDTTNPDPESALVYTDDAVGMTPGSTDWDNTQVFKDIKPCVFMNGAFYGYLSKSDFNKLEDGTSAPTYTINSPKMVEIPKMGYKINYEGNYLYVRVTTNPDAKDAGFCYFAHTRDTEGDKENLYVGVYLGFMLDDKLCSVPNKTPTVNKTISEFREYAHNLNNESYNKGTGQFDLLSFYPLTLLQCLYVIRYKNLNSQAALGQGYTASTNTALHTTGGTDTKGMYYGEQTGTEQMKFCGIEDFYGNAFYFIDGLCTDAGYNILTATKNFNDTGAGYNSFSSGLSSNTVGHMKKVQGTNNTGFILKEANGSKSTYFSDYAGLLAACIPFFGGNLTYASFAGAFVLRMVYDVASGSSTGVGARLMYL